MNEDMKKEKEKWISAEDDISTLKRTMPLIGKFNRIISLVSFLNSLASRR